jgi:hypothetical protein
VPLLYKEGSQRKIQEEISASAEWRRVDRNLTPKVLSTVSHQDRQALLREFVNGILLSDVYFEEGDADLETRVTQQLLQTVLGLWERTLVHDPPEPSFVAQIRERLPEVFSLHPDLRRLANSRMRYRGVVCLTLRQQLERAARVEKGLTPPFSVWLHGDFNPNNVVYNRRDGDLKFIDIHRSRYGDYLQDVTVFLVGLKREPEATPTTRRRLKRIESLVLADVRRFAQAHGDSGFEARLLLGMARSYLTSARIVLQPAHAEWLFREGRLSLQRVIDRV